MIKGWAKEYAEEGMLTDAREMVPEALDTKFSTNIPADAHQLGPAQPCTDQSHGNLLSTTCQIPANPVPLIP